MKRWGLSSNVSNVSLPRVCQNEIRIEQFYMASDHELCFICGALQPIGCRRRNFSSTSTSASITSVREFLQNNLINLPESRDLCFLCKFCFGKAEKESKIQANLRCLVDELRLKFQRKGDVAQWLPSTGWKWHKYITATNKVDDCLTLFLNKFIEA